MLNVGFRKASSPPQRVCATANPNLIKNIPGVAFPPNGRHRRSFRRKACHFEKRMYASVNRFVHCFDAGHRFHGTLNTRASTRRASARRFIGIYTLRFYVPLRPRGGIPDCVSVSPDVTMGSKGESNSRLFYNSLETIGGGVSLIHFEENALDCILR